MTPIAHIRTPFAEKFGVPRQSGLLNTPAIVEFEPEYRNPDAFRGLEDFSHLWLIWHFDRCDTWNVTVRPPRLGGNIKMGVFATRSPFRPNHLGLSCVRLERIEMTSDGPVLHVIGADLVDGTPIFDVKPYLPYCDSHSDAKGGWTDGVKCTKLQVTCPEGVILPDGLTEVLASDPRPRYQEDPNRTYGLTYGGKNVKFRVVNDTVEVLEEPI